MVAVDGALLVMMMKVPGWRWTCDRGMVACNWFIVVGRPTTAQRVAHWRKMMRASRKLECQEFPTKHPRAG